MDIAAWLRGLGQERFEQAFRDSEIDAELLFVASLLHDLGLVPAFDAHAVDFEHAGGAVARVFAAGAGWPEARQRRLADRLFVSCGVFEPLITPNRSMVPTFEAAGMSVRYVETRDGHTWENWRDTLRDALSWVYPGPQKWVYE